MTMPIANKQVNVEATVPSDKDAASPWSSAPEVESEVDADIPRRQNNWHSVVKSRDEQRPSRSSSSSSSASDNLQTVPIEGTITSESDADWANKALAEKSKNNDDSLYTEIMKDVNNRPERLPRVSRLDLD